MVTGVGGSADGEHWGQKVASFLDSTMQKKSESRFVYIKNEDVQIFDNPSMAKKEGFSPIPLHVLFDLSLKSLNSNPETKQISERLLTRLHDPVVAARYQALFDLAVKPASQWSVISDEMSKTLNRQLDQLTSFQVSSRGETSGVYFLQLQTEETPLAIKFDKECWEQLQADSYFKALDFPVSNYSVIGRDTPLGEKLFFKWSSGDIDVHFTNLSSQSDRFMKQLRHTTAIVMETLDGTSLENMVADEIPRLLNIEQFVQKLGEIIFLDMVIGNYDRLSLKLCNLGNIIVNNDRVFLIDHSYKLKTQDDLYNAQKNLALLWNRESGNLEKIIDKFLENLTMKKIPVKDIQRDALIDHMRKGIILGRQRFLQTFANEEAVSSIFKVPSGNRPLFIQLYTFIQESIDE